MFFLRFPETQFPMCVCMWNSHTKNNSQTPAVCPNIQLNSDTIYMEVASDSIG